MKKMIITMLAALCCAGAFAEEFFTWTCTAENRAKHEECIANPEYSPWRKIGLSVNMALFENPEAFKTYQDLTDFILKKSKEFKTTCNIPQQVYCRPNALKHLDIEAVQDCIATNNFMAIHFARQGRIFNMNAMEKWRTLSNIMIDGDMPAGTAKVFVEYLFVNDIRIPKAEKVEVYNMLYEKLFPRLADEQNLANDKKQWTPTIGKLALKLKVLGVNVTK